MTFKDEMIAFRAKHNLSQIKMAELAKVTPQTISYIENDITTPTKLTQGKLRLAMNEYERKAEEQR